MALAGAIQLALGNTAIIKQDVQFLSTSNPLHFNVEAASSSLDAIIQENSVNFGSRGIFGAMSDFAPDLSGRMLWGRDEQVQNNLFTGGLIPGQVLTEETAQFQLSVGQTNMLGGRFAVEHNIAYSGNNFPGQLFKSAYTGDLGFRYTQPLWAGSGPQFTSIAGPVSSIDTRVLSVNQGILIARINSEQERIAFEESVNQLVKGVTDLFWELSLNRQILAEEETSQQRLKQLWELEETELEVGRGSTSREAEAADAYFSGVARVEEARTTVDNTELRLRRLIGLPTRDGTQIVPFDHPEVSPPTPEYSSSLADALTLRPELKRSKWQLKSLQLQLTAARKLVAPRVDLQAGYHVNGFGDDLMASDNDDGVTSRGYGSYYGDLTQNNATGWDLGVVFAMPLGFPQERAQARNLEYRLVKAQTSLAAQELEVTQELQYAYQEASRWRKVTSAIENRLAAARRRLAAVEAEFEADRIPLGDVIAARTALTRAAIDRHRGWIGLAMALAEIDFRRGRILESQQIALRYPEQMPGNLMRPSPEQKEVPVPPPVLPAPPGPGAGMDSGRRVSMRQN